jgi:hypothetical protein
MFLGFILKAEIQHLHYHSGSNVLAWQAKHVYFNSALRSLSNEGLASELFLLLRSCPLRRSLPDLLSGM